MKSLSFARAGSVTRPLSATYSAGYLTGKGYLNGAGNVKVPVYGLHDGVSNDVTLTYLFKDRQLQSADRQ